MRRIELFFVAAGTLCVAFPAPAATRYVDLNNPAPASPYMSWGAAATNIQDAVDAAVDGDEVLVTNGVYAAGGRAVYGAMTNRVAINKAVTVRSVNGPLVTLIEGRAVPGTTNGDGAIRCVYVGANAVLSGFTMTNGHTRMAGDYIYEQSGGGAWCEFSGVVSNCTLSGNSASYYSGGAYYGTLDNCILSANSADSGGGASFGALNKCVLNGNSASATGGGAYLGTLKNCTLSTNSAFVGGGAYYCTLDNCTLSTNSASGTYAGGGGASGGTLNNCTLIGNSASGVYAGGGGTSYGTLNNCTLRGNLASWLGGGASGGTLNNCALMDNSAYIGGGAFSATLSNCTLIGNSASDFGGGAASDVLNNCILYYNSAPDSQNYHLCTFSYSCTMPLPDGPGNIADAPLFVDTNGWSDLRLQVSSPCINAGANAYAPGSADLDGRPRIAGGTVDMGAYEFQNPASVISYAWLQSHSLPTDGSADYADPDGDGLNNWQEWMAGTSPTNSASVLKILSAKPDGANVVVSWSSVSTRAYSLVRATDLMAVPAFSVVWSNIAGVAGTTSFTDTNPPAGPAAFYRVGVQPP